MATNGIDRTDMAREVNQLRSEQLLTLTREEARDLINELPDSAEELGTCLDYAQGEPSPSWRYVVIYIEP